MNAALPAHHDYCYVCGPHNPAGTGVIFRRDGDRIVGEAQLDQRHQGVPGLAHGGVIAALVDDAAGAVLIGQGLRFVTARLDVEYLAPVVIGEPLDIAAWLDDRNGRKNTVITELRTGATLLATGRVLFVTVPIEHFTSRGVEPGAFPHFGL
jgi:acyl-coenzyme A thioesterase PaaI-like protein